MYLYIKMPSSLWYNSKIGKVYIKFFKKWLVWQRYELFETTLNALLWILNSLVIYSLEALPQNNIPYVRYRGLDKKCLTLFKTPTFLEHTLQTIFVCPFHFRFSSMVVPKSLAGVTWLNLQPSKITVLLFWRSLVFCSFER